MGKIILTPKQQLIWSEANLSAFLKKNFYFTGGTALSLVYLHHRFSEDLDFFSQENFESLAILNLINEWSQKLRFKFSSEDREVVKIYILEFTDGEKLKVDFGYYPYRRLEKGKIIDSMSVDSLLDIAVNKLQTIHQRSDIKDFVDLYFLLKEYTVWDLMEGVREKFRMDLDPYAVSSDFLKVDQFETLPNMLTPLEIKSLKSFFRDLAKKLGKSFTK